MQPAQTVRTRSPEKIAAERRRIVDAARQNSEQTIRELAQRSGVTYHFAWEALRDAGVHVRAGKPGRPKKTGNTDRVSAATAARKRQMPVNRTRVSQDTARWSHHAGTVGGAEQSL